MTTHPVDPGPDLRELLAAAADEAGAEYDVSTQLVRWAERQRAEEISARARRRWHAILATAAVLALVVGAAVLVRPQQSQAPAPPAQEQTDVGLPVGAWRASVAHVHLTPAGSSTVLTGVYLRVDRTGTGTIRLPEMNEPLTSRSSRAAATASGSRRTGRPVPAGLSSPSRSRPARTASP
jgi:hypothetical protein